MVRSRSYIAIPPGETIKEMLEDRGITQKEFAARIGMSEKHVSKLMNGEVQLTMDMAKRLETVLGPSVQFWCRLEAFYREDICKSLEENAMEEDIAIARQMPYKQMAKLGWVDDISGWPQRVTNLRKFFEVAQLKFLKESLLPAIACRKLSDTEKSDLLLMAWAQKAKLEARQVVTKPFKVEGLLRDILKLRNLTVRTPEEFCGELVEMLANRGVALVFMPHMSGSFLHGATFRDGKKIVIGITVRGKDADKFWFSLFHELGHIVKGHVGKAGGTDEADEQEADAFARDMLIPAETYTEWTAQGNFGTNEVCRFADSIGIDAGIVVGRLQKDGYIAYNYLNNLKTKYEFSA